MDESAMDVGSFTLNVTADDVDRLNGTQSRTAFDQAALAWMLSVSDDFAHESYLRKASRPS